MKQDITRIGIDLAKNIFQVCATNAAGKVISNKTVKRAKLTILMANQKPCEVILEACATSNYWARVFSAQGHSVKLIHPAYVRPYVKTNKNDARAMSIPLRKKSSNPLKCIKRPSKTRFGWPLLAEETNFYKLRSPHGEDRQACFISLALALSSRCKA